MTKSGWQDILKSMPIAPSVMRGELPRKSPPIWRFINPRVHHQVIGMCVGRGTARMIECLLRIPASADANSTPLPTVDISSLFNYWIARRYSIEHGINFGGEGNDDQSAGAIVSHAILALADRGVIPREQWPDDEAHEEAYRDSRPPAPEDFAAGLKHQILTKAILDTKAKILQYLSMGYPVAQGIPINEGWLQTDNEGHFRDAGQEIGGHCTCLCGYDLDEGWVAVLNSWPRWGRRSTDPMFGGESEGYTNIGYLPMENFDRHFSESAMGTGQAEAVVANTVEGFDKPKIEFDFQSWYGSAKPA